MEDFEQRVLDPARLETLSQLQYDILCNAVELVKEGGQVVYSTCSLSQLQNEDIVLRAIESFKDKGVRLDVVDLTKELSAFDKLAEFGFVESKLRGTVRVLPSVSCCGGMYIAKLAKAITLDST